MKRFICYSVTFSIVLIAVGVLTAADRSPPTDGRANHWAFVPLASPTLPDVESYSRVRTGVDRFIQAKLEAKGLQLGPDADRATLIRRVAFDLTGLPPSPSEIQAFLTDSRPDAYERLVDRYLASPHYGERWGKYWLDATGYADSNGYRHSDSIRPYAYRYRDYVINAFNNDKPYDLFVREQLAGDEMACYDPDGEVTYEMVENLTATHFLLNPSDGTGGSDGNPDEMRLDRFYVLEGVLQVTMHCLLGITIECARCHDHKYEPISQKEYYQLQSIFYPTFTPEPFHLWLTPNQRVIEVGTRVQKQQHKKRVAEVQHKLDDLSEALRLAGYAFRQQVIQQRLVALNEAQREAILAAWETSQDKARMVTQTQKELLKMYRKQVAITDDELAEQFPAFAKERERVNQATVILREKMPEPLLKLAASFEKNPDPPQHHVLLRGSYTDYGDGVEPDVPAALTTSTNQFNLEPKPKGRISSGRRTAFARWVTSPENPLFRRVMVNRIWQQHFGVGIVPTTENFGVNGASPTHPQLLDYLAVEFRRHGDRVKPMHRLLMHSSVYRQSSAIRDRGLAEDADNRLWWRFPLRRLDAEAIRDGMLTVSGELDLKRFGPYVSVTRQGDGEVLVDERLVEGAYRRSVYIQQRRSQVLSILEVFDAPAMVRNCARRHTSTSALQSLALLNSEFIQHLTKAFAERIVGEGTSEDQQRLTKAYLLAVGRPPNTEERQAMESFLASQRILYQNREKADKLVWSDLCQMILASSAFLYVE